MGIAGVKLVGFCRLYCPITLDVIVQYSGVFIKQLTAKS